MQISPYLTFSGDCEAAFKFYQQSLGGELTMSPFGETPACDHVPADWKNKIMHARLQIGDTVLMASDNPPGMQQPAAGFSVSMNVDTPAEAERIFAALAEGGKIMMPIEKTFWADRFGMLVDQFGTPWMINCEGTERGKP